MTDSEQGSTPMQACLRWKVRPGLFLAPLGAVVLVLMYPLSTASRSGAQVAISYESQSPTEHGFTVQWTGGRAGVESRVLNAPGYYYFDKVIGPSETQEGITEEQTNNAGAEYVFNVFNREVRTYARRQVDKSLRVDGDSAIRYSGRPLVFDPVPVVEAIDTDLAVKPSTVTYQDAEVVKDGRTIYVVEVISKKPIGPALAAFVRSFQLQP